MSTLTAQVFGLPVGADRIIVPPPSEPMSVAREVIRALYSNSAGLTFRYHRGDFYRWNGTSWPVIASPDVRAAVYQFLEHAQYMHPRDGVKSFAPTRKKIDDIMDAMQAIVSLESTRNVPMWTETASNDLPSTELVAMSNGLLHMPTRTLVHHTPRFFAHHALPFAFTADAPPPVTWIEFLHQLWPHDEMSIATLQEIVGYVLGGDTRLQKLFLLVGPPRAGKGTIGRVLTGLMGEHNVAAPTRANLSTNFGLQPLISRSLALVSDARFSSQGDGKIVLERLLSISGEDGLTVDRKHRESWTGRLPTRFVILTNELPKLTDSSGAFASRFIVLVLTESFLGAEDSMLTDRLLAEAPSIFNWALEGLDRLNARGHFVHPDSGVEAIQQLQDLSSPVLAFVRDCCMVGRHEVEVDALWRAWRSWCESENRHPGSKEMFGRDLRAAVPTVKRIKPRTEGGERVYTYEGIGLRDHDANNSAADLGPRGPRGPDERGGPSGPGSAAHVSTMKRTSDFGGEDNVER